MTDNSGTPKNEQNLKALIAKGMIGAVSIAGATAIPLLVQKFLGHVPAANQVPALPAQMAPAQVAPTQEKITTSDTSSNLVPSDYDSEQGRGKKKKKDKHKD